MTMSSLKHNFEYKDLLGHLKCHPKEVTTHLYQHPFACAAVFGELPELAKHFILRVIFLGQPVPLSMALAWINDDNSCERDVVMKALNEMHILVDESMNGMPVFKLQEDFKKNLRIILGGRKEECLGIQSLERDKFTKNVDFLDQYARKRWQCILNFIVKSEKCEQALSDIVAEVLVHAGFIEMEGNTHNITAMGFTFLLLDVTKQVWVFILKFLEVVHKKGTNYLECLLLLFKLNYMPMGNDYSTTNLSENMLTILQYLREFGLVYQRTRKCQRFSVTRFASNLTTKTCQEIKLDTDDDAGLIIDNDYTINASDPSGNLNALLDIFTNELFKTEGRKICQMDRSSCMRALKFGITASQLVQFLRSHASKVTSNSEHSVPPTVVDQIYLWEAELNKVKSTEGTLYKDFKSQSEFDSFRNIVMQMDVVVWQNQAKRIIIITREGHVKIQARFGKSRN